jgi:hypothetical protein
MFALALDIGYSGGASPEYTDFSCLVDLDIEAGYSGISLLCLLQIIH